MTLISMQHGRHHTMQRTVLRKSKPKPHPNTTRPAPQTPLYATRTPHPHSPLAPQPPPQMRPLVNMNNGSCQIEQLSPKQGTTRSARTAPVHTWQRPGQMCWRSWLRMGAAGWGCPRTAAAGQAPHPRHWYAPSLCPAARHRTWGQTNMQRGRVCGGGGGGARDIGTCVPKDSP